jgi:hypothetical protein
MSARVVSMAPVVCRPSFAWGRAFRSLDGVCARLMGQAGISGLVKVKRGRTTIRVPGVRVADDLVEREFRPPGESSGGR